MTTNKKTQVLNIFRLLFKNRLMENFFYLLTKNRKNGRLITRFPANHYQYEKGSLRTVIRNRFRYDLDLSEYLQWIIFYGIRNEPRDELYSRIHEGMTVLDIGANIGETTLNFSRKVGKGGRVISFEPDEDSYKTLLHHIEVNHAGNVIPLKRGLGDKAGSGFLNKADEYNSGGDFITKVKQDDSNLEVRIDKLDNVIDELQLRKIDFIKIDVEGFEKRVLEGGKQTLIKHKPVLFIELDNELLAKQNNSSSEIIRFLMDIGYCCYHVETHEKVIPEDNFENTHFDILCLFEEKKTIAYVISQIDHSVLFQTTAEILKKENQWKLVFILLHSHSSKFEESLLQLGITVYRIPFKSKRNVPMAILRIRKILLKEKIDIVHTHLFEAGLAGMLGGRLAGIKHRIHTRHDAMIHHTYHPQAVKYDKIINRNATHIVAISENIKSILIDLEKVPAEKISVIHHGFDFERMNHSTPGSAEEIRAKYLERPGAYPVIGCISRLIEWKGVQYLVPAFEKLLIKWPEAHLIIANSIGTYSGEIHKLLEKIPSKNYTLIPFEPKVMELYKLMDVFVHVPVDAYAEAFGQVYIEAMYAEKPLVATKSGIGSEILEDNKNAVIVSYKSSEDIHAKLDRIVSDKELQKKIAHQAKMDVMQHFPINNMIEKLNHLYESLR
jgi:FkbM family methyltransferase